MLDFNTEKFIAEIKGRPAIWNPEDPQYCNRRERNKSWDEVCWMMYNEFDEKESYEKAQLCKLLQKKWRSVRDSFTRELSLQRKEQQSGISRSTRKKYIYFDLLTFLQQKQAPSSISEDDHDTGDPSLALKSEVFLDDENGSDIEEGCTDEQLQRIQDEMDYSYQYDHLESNANKSSMQAEGSRKRQYDEIVSAEVKILDEVSKRLCKKTEGTITDNHDRLFLLSIEGDLNQVPEEYKLDAKSEILLVLKKWKNPQ